VAHSTGIEVESVDATEAQSSRSSPSSPNTCAASRPSIRDLAHVHDAADGWHDPSPTLYSTVAIAHVAGTRGAQEAIRHDGR
jgi:hypothetical protein